MAVAETAGSCSKSPSGTTKARRRPSNCLKSAKSDGFTLSNVPPAQWIRAQAAPIFLVDSGIAYAKAFNLRPGIALSEAQMAQLTSDIVWLVEQTVTLPDGSTVQALVPQVYVANIRPGDMDGSGALLSAQAININIKGDVNNSGNIGTSVGTSIGNNINGNIDITGNLGSRTLVTINAANINNLQGNIQASQLSVGIDAVGVVINVVGY